MSSDPTLAPSSLNCTPATPLACPEFVEGSDALAETVTTEPETVAALTGDVMETVGNVVIVGGVRVVIGVV